MIFASVLVQVIIAIAFAVLAYLLAPKPKQPKPPAASDLESPTADAGRPVPVVFGEVTVTGVNILGFWDKQVLTYKVKV